jgi:hypothetical protein
MRAVRRRFCAVVPSVSSPTTLRANGTGKLWIPKYPQGPGHSRPARIAFSPFPILRMSPSGLVISFRKEVAGHTGQVTDQSELVFDGRGIGDQPGVIDIAVVDGSSRIEMSQVCPAKLLKRRVEIAIGGLQAVFTSANRYRVTVGTVHRLALRTLHSAHRTRRFPGAPAPPRLRGTM